MITVWQFIISQGLTDVFCIICSFTRKFMFSLSTHSSKGILGKKKEKEKRIIDYCAHSLSMGIWCMCSQSVLWISSNGEECRWNGPVLWLGCQNFLFLLKNSFIRMIISIHVIFFVPWSDLSSYTPKHSVDFSAWQEKKLSDSGDANSQPAVMSDEVMVSHLFSVLVKSRKGNEKVIYLFIYLGDQNLPSSLLGTPEHLHIYLLSNQPITWQQKKPQKNLQIHVKSVSQSLV